MYFALSLFSQRSKKEVSIDGVVDKFEELHFNQNATIKFQSGGRLFFPIQFGALPLEEMILGLGERDGVPPMFLTL